MIDRIGRQAWGKLRRDLGSFDASDIDHDECSKRRSLYRLRQMNTPASISDDAPALRIVPNKDQ